MADRQSTKEYIDLLKEYCTNCEQEGKLGEADSSKRKIAQLEQISEKLRQKALEKQQLSERLDIEDSHYIEFQNSLSTWDSKQTAHHTYAQRQIQKLTDSQKEQRVKLLDKLNKEIPTKPKPTSEILNLQKIQALLVKQKEFSEAKDVKKKIKQLQTQENRQWNSDRQKKIDSQMGNLVHKQEGQLNALRIKLKSIENEIEKQRILEIESLLQRYHNVKKGLQNHQIIQQNK